MIVATLTVNCPSGITAVVQPDVAAVTLSCPGASVVPESVASQGCPSEFPACSSYSHAEMGDALEMSGAVVAVWAVSWGYRQFRRSL